MALKPGEMGMLEAIDYVLRVLDPDGPDYGPSVDRDALLMLKVCRDREADAATDALDLLQESLKVVGQFLESITPYTSLPPGTIIPDTRFEAMEAFPVRVSNMLRAAGRGV